MPARAILALTRALYAAPPHSKDAIYPVPYAALSGICQTHGGQGAGFLGNPRISFQHQAQRMRLETGRPDDVPARGPRGILAAQALPPGLPDDALKPGRAPNP